MPEAEYGIGEVVMEPNPRPMSGMSLRLTPQEKGGIRKTLQDLSAKYASCEGPGFLMDLPLLSQELPLGVRRFVNAFRLLDAQPYLLVKGHAVDQAAIGKTPSDWRKMGISTTLSEEVLLLLYAGLLGEPFGWKTQQDGKLIHDVFPIERDKREQLGTGSLEVLSWHSEDAFHEYRADYLLLFAIRNPNRAATTIGYFPVDAIDKDTVSLLFEERFFIKPDESHLTTNNTALGENSRSFSKILRMQADPAPVSILSGDPQSPYLRLDPYFMSTRPGDIAAESALRAVTRAIDDTLQDLVLQEGDMLILDNRRAVHGRRVFFPTYDGNDRWLKRVNVTRDIRKSRISRSSSICRKIG